MSLLRGFPNEGQPTTFETRSGRNLQLRREHNTRSYGLEVARSELFLEANGLVKRFGRHVALDGVGLALHKGQLVALLGPNGAGKTTLISILTGLRSADSGIVRLFGADPREPHARRQIGVTPQNIGFPKGLRVREVIDFVRGHSLEPIDADELAERFALGPMLGRVTTALSGGEMRRLALAVAFAGRPFLVFLDEPTTGLDVEMRRRMWDDFRAYVDNGGTVLLTTHYLEEAEALADHLIVVNEGTVVSEGTVDEIRGRLAVTRIRFQAPEPVSLPGFDIRKAENGWCTLETTDPDGAVRALVSANVPFCSLEVMPLRLEEAVIHIWQPRP